jgi:hypothetical protein
MKKDASLINTPDSQSDFRLFIPISKVDKEKREVIGIATAEFLDSQDEVLAYEGSKDAVKNWVGNVREMHQAKAVGKRVGVEFDDTKRTIEVRSRVSRGAADTWEKVLDETLIGYSIGGKRVETTVKKASECPERVFKTVRGKKPEKVRWTSKWDMGELSLVDSPALPVATIELVKSEDGELTLTPVTGDVEIPETGTEAIGGENKNTETVKSDPPAASPPAPKAEKDVGVTAEEVVTEGDIKPPDASSAKSGDTHQAGGSVPPGNPPATPDPLIKTKWESAMALARASQDRAGAVKALPALRANAKKLKIGEFRQDPDNFLRFHNVYAMNYGDGDELEGDAPLAVAEIVEFLGLHAEKPLLKFTIQPKTFGEVLAFYRQDAAWREFWEVLDILPSVLANIVLDPDLDLGKKRSLIDQSFEEFTNAIFEELAGLQPEASKSSSEAAPEEGESEVEKAELEAVQKNASDAKAATEELAKRVEGLTPEAIAKAVGEQMGEKFEGMKAEVEKKFGELGDRIGKIEAQPVVPSGTRLKVVEKGQEIELPKGRTAGSGNPEGEFDLAKATARYAEIEKQLKSTSADDPGREDLAVEGIKLARQIKIATGQPVWK